MWLIKGDIMPSDPGNISLYYLILALIILMNALVVLCETAYGNLTSNSLLNEAGDNKDKNKKLLKAARIIDRPFRCRFTDRMISCILITIGVIIAAKMPYEDYIAPTVFLVLLITMGDLLPMKLAIQHTYKVVLSMAGFQSFLMTFFYPLVLILTAIADFFLMIFKQERKVEMQRYSEDDVMSILEVGQETGEIKEEGKKMINSIFEFDDELAYEVMTPRTDVFMIDINDNPDEYLDQLMKLRYSRIPVYEDDPDNIQGVLHIKDYLIKAREEGFDNVDIRSILRKAYLVPETKNIDALFFELQKERQHIAILIDEYGGFSGIVTLEDIIEEVMGEIDDEYDEESKPMIKVDNNIYIVNGNEDLDDINEEIGTELESEDSETIGGLVIDLLGEIPANTDIGRSVEYKNYELIVLSIRDRRIEKVKIIINPDEEESDDQTSGKIKDEPDEEDK
jgi:putative hemolysin